MVLYYICVQPSPTLYATVRTIYVQMAKVDQCNQTAIVSSQCVTVDTCMLHIGDFEVPIST